MLMVCTLFNKKTRESEGGFIGLQITRFLKLSYNLLYDHFLIRFGTKSLNQRREIAWRHSPAGLQHKTSCWCKTKAGLLCLKPLARNSLEGQRLEWIWVKHFSQRVPKLLFKALCLDRTT